MAPEQQTNPLQCNLYSCAQTVPETAEKMSLRNWQIWHHLKEGFHFYSLVMSDKCLGRCLREVVVAPPTWMMFVLNSSLLVKSSQKCLSCFSDLIETFQNNHIYTHFERVVFQHCHLQQGFHSRSLQAQQADPSRAFSASPGSSLVKSNLCFWKDTYPPLVQGL